ncbi:SRPBCC family protein [Nocardioides sp. GXQ0305]|uniref:SRPBCC family protein n=1 Tax=Nocardioides sp. GXQ0305 TaxID=3423912 RepID=UPI003D7D5EFB
MARTEPMDALKNAGRDFLGALGDKARDTVSDRVGGLTDRLEGIADGGPITKAVAEGGKASAEGKSPVGGALKGAVTGIKDKITGGSGGSGGGSKATKSTNIVETIDVGVPVSVAYNQWTEFGSFPTFMKKVESVEAADETKINWKAQIFWSHRTWEATILEQVPDERIVWRSKGEKGHVDGAVTFHEVGPNLTRILVVLEYYPQGFFEKTGNIWEAQGRRARAELRHFRRHVMTRTILEPAEVEGWRGRIEDGEVVQSHEEALEEEQAAEADEGDAGPEDEGYDESAEEGEEEPEAEAEEYEEEPEAEEYEEEPEADAEDYEEEPEAEEYEEEPEADAEEYEEEPEADAEDYEEEPEADAEEYEDEPEAEEYEEEPEAEEESEDDRPRRRRRR